MKSRFDGAGRSLAPLATGRVPSTVGSLNAALMFAARDRGSPRVDA